jgi:hypothetical protein
MDIRVLIGMTVGGVVTVDRSFVPTDDGVVPRSGVIAVACGPDSLVGGTTTRHAVARYSRCRC